MLLATSKVIIISRLAIFGSKLSMILINFPSRSRIIPSHYFEFRFRNQPSDSCQE